MSLRVRFFVRRDLAETGGGDAVQILRTRAELERLGVTVELSDVLTPDKGRYDLAHLWHLGRIDTYVQAQALARREVPFVLSTIYWPTGDSNPGAMAKDLARALLMRAEDGLERQSLLNAATTPFSRRAAWLAMTAARLLPNSRAETEVIPGMTPGNVSVVVNAADPIARRTGLLPAGIPRPFLLSVGRLEPRKNQLTLARALRGFRLPLVIVGASNPRHRGYVRELRQLGGEGLILLPPMRREALYPLYAACEAHLAPALYETPGLASLEAAAAGTRVVTTEGGCPREYFGDEAEYFDPRSERAIRDAIERAMARPKNERLRQRVLTTYTWEQAARQTLEAYQLVLGNRR